MGPEAALRNAAYAKAANWRARFGVAQPTKLRGFPRGFAAVPDGASRPDP